MGTFYMEVVESWVTYPYFHDHFVYKALILITRASLTKRESRCFSYLDKNMACFIRSSAFLNFLLTTHAWKNKNVFFPHHY